MQLHVPPLWVLSVKVLMMADATISQLYSLVTRVLSFVSSLGV